jgi:hypothetical protein
MERINLRVGPFLLGVAQAPGFPLQSFLDCPYITLQGNPKKDFRFNP